MSAEYTIRATEEIVANASPLRRIDVDFGAVGNALRDVKGIPLLITNTNGFQMKATIEKIPQNASDYVLPTDGSKSESRASWIELHYQSVP
jgi:hypothetical protein